MVSAQAKHLPFTRASMILNVQWVMHSSFKAGLSQSGLDKSNRLINY